MRASKLYCGLDGCAFVCAKKLKRLKQKKRVMRDVYS